MGDDKGRLLVWINGASMSNEDALRIDLPRQFRFTKGAPLNGYADEFLNFLSKELNMNVTALYYKGHATGKRGRDDVVFLRFSDNGKPIASPFVPGMVVVACIDGDMGPPMRIRKRHRHGQSGSGCA